MGYETFNEGWPLGLPLSNIFAMTWGFLLYLIFSEQCQRVILFIIFVTLLTSLEAFPRQRQNDERRAENDEYADEKPLER